jgi:hypothetical protein
LGFFVVIILWVEIYFIKQILNLFSLLFVFIIIFLILLKIILTLLK